MAEAAIPQDAVGAGDDVLGVKSVVPRLAENGEIDHPFRDRRIFDVA